MAQAHISELGPELPAIESKHFRATVTLIWPYSSSARQFALLLVEPDVRLRRKNGQVRARFSGASAKAVATTGVGIGDEVVLSLRGAQFVKEGAISTPGKSIEWELSYAHSVVLQIYRNGTEIASLELVDAAPTPAPESPAPESPAPESPARRQSAPSPAPALEFSSPAFLKRARLSDEPFFQAPFDALADETEEGHDKKRRRKSYRDWKAWTYSARTPSPEKEDATMEDELESAEASPSRAGQLPRTPVSPPQPEMLSVAAGPLDTLEDETTEPDTPTDQEARVVYQPSAIPKADVNNYDLYAEPDEHPASYSQYAFGGDTEIDTEVNTEEESPTHGELNGDGTSTTEADSEEQEDGQLERVEENVVVEAPYKAEPVLATGAHSHVKNELVIAMPPPTLPTSPAITAGLLTPVGREPASPKLVPQDASNLPMPSPFPGEQDANASSYFGATSTGPQLVGDDAVAEEGQELPSEASYIGETSFFSSIGSSRASVFHPNHESAFTPVRFTFGMDGAGFLRPLDLSSPPPEAQPIEEQASKAEAPASFTTQEGPNGVPETENMSRSRQSTIESEQSDEDVEDLATANSQVAVDEPGEPDVIELLEEGEEDSPSDTEMDSMTAEQLTQSFSVEQPEEVSSTADDLQPMSGTLEGTGLQEPLTGKLGSTATSAVVDLGSPSDDNSEVESSHEHQQLQSSRHGSPTQDQSSTMDVDSHSEFVNLDLTTEHAYAFDTTVEQTTTHTQSQEPEPDAIPRQMEERLSPVGHPPDSIFEATDDYLQDAFPMEHASFVQEHEQVVGLEHDHQSDLKVDLIEEATILPSKEFNTQLGPEQSAQAATESASHHYSTAPKDDQKTGSVDVVPESPVKSSRSKAKTAASPKKEEASIDKPNTRSRESVTSVARSAVSPPRTRTRSILSPSQESTQTSPYSLRSQSRQFSPAESFSAGVTHQKRLRRNPSQRSVNSTSNFGTLQTQDHDQFVSSFEPSQELGASQDRYSDVAFVKDSEEESVRSEHSISTMYPSEDMAYMHYSDPVDRATIVRDKEDEDSKPPSATAPELRRIGRRTKRKEPEPQVIIEVHSSSPARPGSSHITQPLHSISGMQQRVAQSQETTTFSPPNVRRTRRKVYEIDESTTPKASQKVNEQTSSGEGEGEGSQGTVDIDELMRSSPPGTPTIDRRRKTQSKKLITPNATQQTAMDSQSSSGANRGQDTLMTPQLTQTTSTGLRSYQAGNEANAEAISVSPNLQTTAVSPALVDPSSDDADSDTPEEPSVGLSTPLAYYTPLKDLVYFINRSSQFHSAANPDTLALVTSPTTPSEKAKKGPKHWFTTLQVTDASSWPQTTTIQIFRVHQTALPEAQVGDVILLRAFAVKSLNRHPTLVSADESAWCVWRWGRPIWGAKRGAFGELRAREETKGPAVERGEGEWREVEKLRGWWLAKIQNELAEKEEGRVKTRSKDKGKEAANIDA
ncbi:hypothetical protein G6011_03303 [Alternaria panax]|uniref:Telomeric single stranded DNA binding POT1/Cdc13 domain-containing protein n=1 Tax=Alternaria panax TaxID=48097 RepID=A0AAD4NSI6_9PLEO|nr:hypothetical protein G6011_03303 [Alternaria panax]